MEPTKEQIQWFWEQCEFKFQKSDRNRVGTWVYPNYECEWSLPSIDLNNLFKYAVPKLRTIHNDLKVLFVFGSVSRCAIFKWDKKYSRKKNFEWLLIGERTDDDPALALFWAIYKALGGENGS